MACYHVERSAIEVDVEFLAPPYYGESLFLGLGVASLDVCECSTGLGDNFEVICAGLWLGKNGAES